MRWNLLLAAAVLLARPALADDSIHDLAPIATHAQEGASAVLEGTAPAEAFEPWTAGETKGLDGAKSAGAAGAVFFGMEFEILFKKEGKDVYMLRTFVHASGEEVAFLGIEGRAMDAPASVTFHALDSLGGDAAGLAGSARALVAALRAGGEVPIADGKALASNPAFAPMAEALEKGVEKTKAEYPEVQKTVAGLAYDEIQVRVDDLTLFGVDEGGKGVGMLGGSIDVSGGGIEVEFAKYRALGK